MKDGFKIFLVSAYNIAIKLLLWYLLFVGALLFFSVSDCSIRNKESCSLSINFLAIDIQVKRNQE